MVESELEKDPKFRKWIVDEVDVKASLEDSSSKHGSKFECGKSAETQWKQLHSH